MKTSYLVVSASKNHGLMSSLYARSAEEAEWVTAAGHLEWFGEDADTCKVIDVDAAVGVWIPGDPDYLRTKIAEDASICQSR